MGSNVPPITPTRLPATRTSLAGTTGPGPRWTGTGSSVDGSRLPGRSARQPGNHPRPAPPCSRSQPFRPGCSEPAVPRGPGLACTALKNDRRGIGLRGPFESGQDRTASGEPGDSEGRHELGELGGVPALDHVDDLA